MISVVLYLALLIQSEKSQPSQPRVIAFSTSDKLAIAAMVVRDEGFSLKNKSRFDFDEPDYRKLNIPGYYLVEFDWNFHAVHLFAINDMTAQIIDTNSCQVFEYKDLMKFYKIHLNGLSIAPLSPERLGADVGCDKVFVVKERKTK